MSFLTLTRQPDYLSIKANVRALDSSGTTIQLTASDYRTQIFNLGAAQTVILPTGSNIVAGDVWTIKKSDSTAKLTITCPSAASSASVYIPSSSTICYLDSKFASAEFVALQANPTTPDHWDMRFKYLEKEYYSSSTYNGGGSPAVTALSVGAIVTQFVRIVPKQLYDGTWYIHFYAEVQGNTTTTTQNATVNWQAANDLLGLGWPVYSLAAGGGFVTVNFSYVGQGTTTLVQSVAVSRTYFAWMGDLPVFKPTWVY